MSVQEIMLSKKYVGMILTQHSGPPIIGTEVGLPLRPTVDICVFWGAPEINEIETEAEV